MEQMHKGPYVTFAVMVALHFVAMYFLMYAMVNSADEVRHSINQVYMAALMTASMILIELPLMRGMYPNRKRNAVLWGVGVLLLVGSWLGIRQQVAVGDTQFLRSMIPHHSGAILMCREADLKDREVIDLCKQIVEGQQREITQMEAILRRFAQ